MIKDRMYRVSYWTSDQKSGFTLMSHGLAWPENEQTASSIG